MKIIALIVGCVFSLCSTGLSKNYYVSIGGSDKNPVTREKLFRTVQKAADKMFAGDTCYVQGGVYRELVRPKRSGSKNKPIRFEAWPGEMVILSAQSGVKRLSPTCS